MTLNTYLVMARFSRYFFQKIGFEISCKLSPVDIMCKIIQECFKMLFAAIFTQHTKELITIFDLITAQWAKGLSNCGENLLIK